MAPGLFTAARLPSRTAPAPSGLTSSIQSGPQRRNVSCRAHNQARSAFVDVSPSSSQPQIHYVGAEEEDSTLANRIVTGPPSATALLASEEVGPAPIPSATPESLSATSPCSPTTTAAAAAAAAALPLLSAAAAAAVAAAKAAPAAPAAPAAAPAAPSTPASPSPSASPASALPLTASEQPCSTATPTAATPAPSAVQAAAPAPAPTPVLAAITASSSSTSPYSEPPLPVPVPCPATPSPSTPQPAPCSTSDSLPTTSEARGASSSASVVDIDCRSEARSVAACSSLPCGGRDHNSVTIKANTNVKDAAGAVVKVMSRLPNVLVTALKMEHAHEALNRAVKSIAVARKYLTDEHPGSELSFLPVNRSNAAGLVDPNLFAFLCFKTQLANGLQLLEQDKTDLNVSRGSNANAMANAIIRILKERGQAVMKAGGSEAIFIAMSAVVNARCRLKRSHNMDAMVVPAWITEDTRDMLGRESKFLRLNILPCAVNGPLDAVPA